MGLPGTVWQAMQSPACARYFPRSTCADAVPRAAGFVWACCQAGTLVATMASNNAASIHVRFRLTMIDTVAPPDYGFWLPQTSGSRSDEGSTGLVLAGIGMDASQAATAVTSASVRRAAMTCMQS